MSDSASSTALAGRHLIGSSRVALHASCWTLASLGTALALYGLIGLVAAQQDEEAARLRTDVLSGKAYLEIVVGAFAARHGRADR